MKFNIYTIAASLFLFSCNKNKDANMAYSNDTGIRISSFKTENAEVKISYDNNGQISTIISQVRQPGIGPVPFVNIVTTTTNFTYANSIPATSTSNLTMSPGDITLNTNTIFKWNLKGALMETSRDDQYKTTWSADAAGRPTGHSSISIPDVKWSYNQNGDIIKQVEDGNGYTSSITYTSHKNPFNNGRLGLLVYMNGQSGDFTDIIRSFSAHLPEKWETSRLIYIRSLNGEVISENRYTTLTSYTYNFDAAGLLTSINETKKSQSYQNNTLMSSSETNYFYPVNCYKVK